MRPPIIERLREGRSKTPYALEKMEHLCLSMFHSETKFFYKKRSDIVTIKKMSSKVKKICSGQQGDHHLQKIK